MTNKRWLSTILTASACAAAPHATPGAATPAATAATAAPEVVALLRRQTQEMLDAIAIGDRPVWDRYLDPDVMYLSEAGELEVRTRLIAELVPLPTGITGRIELGRFEAKVLGDLAIVFHADEEYEDYFGHAIHAQYLNTATWRRGPTGWKLIATQVYASLLDPPAIQLPASQLDDYAGSYALTDHIHYVIRRDGDHLVGQRDDRPPQPLAIEARDVLFIPGLPRSRKIFARDAAGKVTRFADRREARDIVWTRQ